MNTRVPYDDNYVTMLGRAVYIFSYYEWNIVYIVEKLQPGFLREYCRDHRYGLTSGQLSQRFMNAIRGCGEEADEERSALECCQREFDDLVKKRNALVHAHPITDDDDAQVLNYQASPDKQISDMKWQLSHLREFVCELDGAAVQAGEVLERFR